MYQDDAFAEVVNRGGAESVASGFERPIVVIGGYSLEREVVHAVGFQNSGEASFGAVFYGVVLCGGGDGGRGGLGKKRGAGDFKV